jgi:hypothetical protein
MKNTMIRVLFFIFEPIQAFKNLKINMLKFETCGLKSLILKLQIHFFQILNIVAMKQTFLYLCLLLNVNAFATHNHAGEIMIEQIGEFTIKATVITYTPDLPNFPADRAQLTFCWGDGTMTDIPRVGNGVKVVDSNLKKNVYEATHTFTRAGKYTVCMTDPNRNSGILNLNFPYSDLAAFHIQATITLVPAQANGKYNKTPELRSYPIDVATVGYPFKHFVDAIDADGDSMVYRLVSPMESLYKTIPNYLSPSTVSPSDSNKITFNTTNGTFEWKSPQKKGLYSIAIQVISYRRGVAIDTILRDMNIIVQGGSTTGVESVESPLFAKLSPNPIYTEGVLFIADDFGQNVELTIVNAFGQIVETAYLRNEKTYAIKPKNYWVNGLYFIHLKSATKKTVLKVELLGN